MIKTKALILFVFFMVMTLLNIHAQQQPRRLILEVPGFPSGRPSGVAANVYTDETSRIFFDDATFVNKGNVDLWTLLQSLGGGSGGVTLPEDGVVFIEDIGGTLQLSGNASRLAFDPATSITRMGNGTIAPHFFDFAPILPITLATTPDSILGNNDARETTGLDIHGIGASSNASGTFASYPNVVPSINLFASRGTTDSLTVSSTTDAAGIISFWPNGLEQSNGTYLPGFNFPSAVIVPTVDDLLTTSTVPLGRPITLTLSTLAGADFNLENDGSFGAQTSGDRGHVLGWFEVDQYSELDGGAQVGTVNTKIGRESETDLLDDTGNILILPSGSTGVFTENSLLPSNDDRVLIGSDIAPGSGLTGASDDAIAIGHEIPYTRHGIYIGSSTGSGSADLGDASIGIGRSIDLPGDDSIGIGKFFSGTGLEGDMNLVIGGFIVSSNQAARDNTAWIGGPTAGGAYTLINLNGGENDRTAGFTTTLQTGGIAFATAPANTAAGSFVLNPGKSSGTATSPIFLHAWLPTTSGQNEQTTVGASLILEGGNAAINDDKGNDVSLRVGALEDEKVIVEFTQDETTADLAQLSTRLEQRSITTTDATPTVIWDSDERGLGLPASRVFVDARILAQGWDNGSPGADLGDTFICKVRAGFKIDGAANARIDTADIYFNVEDMGFALTVDLDVASVTGPIELEVTGQAGEPILWGAEIEYTIMPANPE